MKVGFNLMCAISCGAASLGLLWAAFYPSVPNIWLLPDKSVKTLVLQQEEEKEVVFRLTNQGNSSLEITNIVPSCTCTRAEADVMQLQSGGSTELTAHIRVGGLRGEIISQVDVIYRIGAAESVQRLSLLVNVTIEPHYLIKPEGITFASKETADRGLIQRSSIELIPRISPNLKILRAYSTHPAIKVTDVKENLETGMTTVLFAFYPKESLVSVFQADIVVETDSTKQPICRVPVHVVSASPSAGLSVQGD